MEFLLTQSDSIDNESDHETESNEKNKSVNLIIKNIRKWLFFLSV